MRNTFTEKMLFACNVFSLNIRFANISVCMKVYDGYGLLNRRVSLPLRFTHTHEYS